MLNYARFCNSPRPTQALLSIRPRFALGIFVGQKRFEFRRSAPSKHVEVILLYVTAPVGLVVGEFDVASTIRGPVAELWERTKRYAGIDEHIFLHYFKGRDFGYAIEVGGVRIYDKPFSPTEHLGVRPPQSFLYLDLSQVSAVGRHVKKIEAGAARPLAAEDVALRCLAVAKGRGLTTSDAVDRPLHASGVEPQPSID